jgi:hypothetical protein
MMPKMTCLEPCLSLSGSKSIKYDVFNRKKHEFAQNLKCKNERFSEQKCSKLLAKLQKNIVLERKQTKPSPKPYKICIKTRSKRSKWRRRAKIGEKIDALDLV